MFNNLMENLKKNFQEETLAHRSQRMIPAAIYGILIATVYVLTLSFVNVYTFPNLPLGLDWTRMFGMWIGFGAALGLFGAIAAWFTDEAAGIVGGGIIATILLGIVFLFSSGAQTSTSTVQSLIMALTLVGVNMLGAWGLRWAANRHLAIVQNEASKSRRKRLTKHILTLVLVGLVPGILNRMDLNAEKSIGQLHELLQAAPTDQSVWPRLPLKQVPTLQDHFGEDYLIYLRWSALSVGSLDVTVRFEDGFTMSCLLPVSAGMNFITDCNEGDEIELSP